VAFVVWFLNSVHEGGFDAVEDDGADDDDDNHEDERIEQVHGVEGTSAQEGVAEGFDDGGHGVGLDNGLEAGGDGGDRVDDGGGVHEELDAELHQEAQVAVFGGEGGNDDAKSEAEAGHHEDEHGGDQDPPVGAQVCTGEGEETHEGQEEGELDGEGDEVGEQDGDRDCQPGEIDFAE